MTEPNDLIVPEGGYVERPIDRIKAKIAQMRPEPPSYDVDHHTPDYRIRLLNGDCRVVMRNLRERHGVKPKLIFGDPPFNIGQEYNEFRDDMPPEDYLEFTGEWWMEAAKLLAPGGVLAVHVPDNVAELVLRHWPDWSIESESGVERVGWCIWHYRFGQHSHTNWINSKCHLLIFAKPIGGKVLYDFHPKLVPSDRASTYNDKRTQSKVKGKAGERVPLDIFGLPSDGPGWGRVQGNNKERWCKKTGAPYDHPNQLPEKYMERIILAYTDQGDEVLDPFCGAGTTPVVCKALKRKCIAIDLSKLSLESAFARVKRGAVSVT